MYAPGIWTIALRSLRFFLKSHATVILGIAAATAVIVGALVVGDSVRHSLRQLVVTRLANIECLLHARVFFDPSIVATPELDDKDIAISPAILFSSATVERREDNKLTRASQVQVLGVDSMFWSTADTPERGAESFPELATDQIALNQSLANELGVKVGDEITVLVNDPTGAPSDNPLGRREDRAISIPRQEVALILPDQSIGGVSFLSSQAAPRNVFLSLETMQDILECDGQVNAAFVMRKMPSGSSAGKSVSMDGQAICDSLNLQLTPRLEDYGLKLARNTRVFPDKNAGEAADSAVVPQTVFDYYQLSSDELIIDNETSSAVVTKLGRENAARLITYLANSISKIQPLRSDTSYNRRADAFEFDPSEEIMEAPETGRRLVLMGGPSDPGGTPVQETGENLEPESREVPYSIVVGLEAKTQLDLTEYTEVLREDLRVPYCWVNAWLAEQAELSPGDWILIRYFEPETVDGKEVEVEIRCMVAGILPLTEPVKPFQRSRAAIFDSAPTVFNDPNLTPSVPGVTDQDSISNWDVPFKLENEIEKQDDAYWNNHRLTPKVLLPYRYASLPTMFGSRFGRTTAIRIPVDAYPTESELREQIEEALLSTRVSKGLSFAPVRDRQLQAASGTTPFDMLFLSLSFFVIVAALMLVFLLFRLGIQQRIGELGILAAQGFNRSRIRGLLLSEFAIVAAIGSMAGILLGMLYARAIIAGLESWWIGAISTRFLSFSANPLSLVIGALSGFVASLGAIFLGLNKLLKQNPLASLRGRKLDEEDATGRFKRIYLAIAGFIAFAAIALMLAATGQTGMARAGSFFGSGMLLLVAAMLGTRQLLELGRGRLTTEAAENAGGGRWSGGLFQFAWKAICRNPGRSLLSLSLLSVASFLIASMGVFQISPTEKGYGGFNLLAESSLPIYRNIASGSVRADVLGDEAEKLTGTSIVPMRARKGEDASCNNLFQVAQPTILGVSKRLRELHDIAPDSVEFEWAQTSSSANPWSSLSAAATGAQMSPIPVVLDQNTAMWSLKQGAGLNEIITLDIDNKRIYFRTVGLLANSVLQGKLMISQGNFENLFPEISGYSFFLINSGRGNDPQAVTEVLENGWSNEGLDVQYSEEILTQYLGVQNTYISAFQSLGALGLLLGTFGLIAVQVRSVLERRREFAVMRAVGFAPSRLAGILTLETAMLIGGGLLTGILCAAVALVPYVIEVKPALSFFNPILMLLAVMVIGFCAAWIAIRSANRQTVLDGLRSE